MTNHHIRCGHSWARHTSLYLLVSDKSAIFPFTYFRSSMLCLALDLVRATHTRAITGVCTAIHTHLLLLLVVNNVPMAILRLLTRSRPINQTIQLAYDHNKYTLDKCLAVRRTEPVLHKLRPEGQTWWKADKKKLFYFHKQCSCEKSFWTKKNLLRLQENRPTHGFHAVCVCCMKQRLTGSYVLVKQWQHHHQRPVSTLQSITLVLPWPLVAKKWNYM